MTHLVLLSEPLSLPAWEQRPWIEQKTAEKRAARPTQNPVRGVKATQSVLINTQPHLYAKYRGEKEETASSSLRKSSMWHQLVYL